MKIVFHPSLNFPMLRSSVVLSVYLVSILPSLLTLCRLPLVMRASTIDPSIKGTKYRGGAREGGHSAS